ncbi:MAG: hypothetical protein B1H11_10540 [Desulfobacteraceae bacterium 4484_190.1]|nr:MAG: hypothetical protein B1H11_10540 [Desulfobacteraceae bacterium 4484_190.1]
MANMEKPKVLEKDIMPGIAGRIADFAGFLRSRGFRTFQSSIHNALFCLEQIDISNRNDFFNALRANFVSNDMEWSHFTALFNEFWGQHPYRVEMSKKKKGKRDNEDKTDVTVVEDTSSNRQSTKTDVTVEKEWLEGVAYSPVSRVEKTDIAKFDNADIQVAQLALKKITEPFRVQITRRSKKGVKRGKMDFPRVMRHTLKTGGLTTRLFFKEKKKKLKRLIVVADVSGSMERYARFVMPFILGMRGTGSKTDVYVFSTSLTRITFMIKHLSLEKAIDRISQEVPNWSGGTRIGFSLKQLNEEQGGAAINKKTVVLIMSDGWDLGGKRLLRDALEYLKKNAHSIIWLNPLADDPDYRPMYRGMQEALPYIDYFMPVNSLDGLKRVGHLLSKIM